MGIVSKHIHLESEVTSSTESLTRSHISCPDARLYYYEYALRFRSYHSSFKRNGDEVKWKWGCGNVDESDYIHILVVWCEEWIHSIRGRNYCVQIRTRILATLLGASCARRFSAAVSRCN